MLDVLDDGLAVDKGIMKDIGEGPVGLEEVVEGLRLDLACFEELLEFFLSLERAEANKGTVVGEAGSDPEREVVQVHQHSQLAVGPLVQGAVEGALPVLGDEGQEQSTLD